MRREEPEAVALGEVLDLDRRQLRVRHAHHRPLEGADAGGAQPDVLDGPHPGAVAAEVPDADRAVQAERHPAEEVLDGLLGRERQRDAAEAEAGHDPRDVEAEVLEQAENAERDDEHLGGAAAEVEHRDRGAALLAHHPLAGGAGQDGHEPQADPRDEQDGQAARDADEEGLHGHVEPQPVGAAEEEVERRQEPQRTVNGLDDPIVEPGRRAAREEAREAQERPGHEEREAPGGGRERD